jgi:hypothetical protein
MLQGRFTIPHKIRLSPACRDILRRMIHPDPKKRATIRELKNHPWTNEGYAERIPYFNPRLPPVPLDHVIVKRMVQMGYTSKEVQAVVLNNETSPILTTYHAIRNMEMVPDFQLHDASFSATPPHPTTMRPEPTTSPPGRPMNVSLKTSHSVSPESPRLDIVESDVETPPLLAIAREMPQSPDLSSSSPIISTFEELLKNAASNRREYRAEPQESDYYGHSSVRSPSYHSLPNSFYTPTKRHSRNHSHEHSLIRTPPPSPVNGSPSPIIRPRGESDPPPPIEFDLNIEEPNHPRSTPSSPQPSPTLPYPDSPTLEGGRTRAFSAGAAVTWRGDYPQERQSNSKTPRTIFDTLEEENNSASRTFHRQSISSPFISHHQASAPINVPSPKSQAASRPPTHKKSPSATHTNSPAPTQPHPNAPPTLTATPHGETATAPAKSTKESKLSRFLSKLKIKI